MHNLAIALKDKGYQVTGSDDAIFEPSKSRLEKKGIMPLEMGQQGIENGDGSAMIISLRPQS